MALTAGGICLLLVGWAGFCGSVADAADAKVAKEESVEKGALAAEPVGNGGEVQKEVAKKPEAPAETAAVKPAAGKDDKKAGEEAVKPVATPETAPNTEAKTNPDKATPDETPASVDPDDPAAAEDADAAVAAVARPVSADPVQIYGWREHIVVKDVEIKLKAKLDTGALTSSIHAEEKELFERDGKKWMRFIVTDPSMEKPVRSRVEAPLVRIAKIKEPGGESVAREVVRLSFEIGDRKMRGEFTLNNRTNMLSPVLIGRNMIKDLGWVDPGRVYLAEQKVFR